MRVVSNQDVRTVISRLWRVDTYVIHREYYRNGERAADRLPIFAEARVTMPVLWPALARCRWYTPLLLSQGNPLTVRKQYAVAFAMLHAVCLLLPVLAATSPVGRVFRQQPGTGIGRQCGQRRQR